MQRPTARAPHPLRRLRKTWAPLCPSRGTWCRKWPCSCFKRCPKSVSSSRLRPPSSPSGGTEGGVQRGGRTDSGDPGYARRRSRRGHRRPPTQPLGAYGAPLPGRLVASMQCFGRVPIEPHRHRRRIVASWREIRRNLLPVKTIPKSAFTTTYWQYRPLGITELAEGLPFSGGFDFSLQLHAHENRWHLRRSLWAGRTRSRARRLLVIATTRDMFDPESWVRCLVVNANTLRLRQDSLGCAVLRGADPWAKDGPLVYRSRQKDVPDDAVWLMVPTDDYRVPSPSWGEGQSTAASRRRCRSSFPIRTATMPTSRDTFGDGSAITAG